MLRRAVDLGKPRADLDVPLAGAMLEGAVLPWTYERLAAGRTPAALADALLRLFRAGARTATA